MQFSQQAFGTHLTEAIITSLGIYTMSSDHKMEEDWSKRKFKPTCTRFFKALFLTLYQVCMKLTAANFAVNKSMKPLSIFTSRN